MLEQGDFACTPVGVTHSYETDAAYKKVIGGAPPASIAPSRSWTPSAPHRRTWPRRAQPPGSIGALPSSSDVLTLLDGLADDADDLNARIQALLGDEPAQARSHAQARSVERGPRP